MRSYLPGVPEPAATEITAAMQRPEGTIVYSGTYPGLLDNANDRGVLLQVVTGALVFLLQRNEQLVLEFIYASPGAGTYVAKADLHDLVQDDPCDEFFIALTWSPTGNGLHVGRRDGNKLLQATGAPAPYHLAVGADGSIVVLGSEGVQVSGVRVYRGGTPFLTPTAIALWEDTIRAVSTMLSGTSEIGFMYEVVTVNAAIAGLVTGFETYAQQRFVELPNEGVHPSEAHLIAAFLSREERDRYAAGEELDVLAKARLAGVPSSEAIARRINFQNYNETKRASFEGLRDPVRRPSP